MRIDSHQHFWSLDNDYTDWPTPDLTAIHRDFGPDQLRPILAANGVDGTVLVQAAPSLDETRDLLKIAAANPFVKGVVGWIDFASTDAIGDLETLAADPLFRGVRPMLQGMTEAGWILREEFAPIFALLIERDLTFDGLVRADQIGELATLALRYPALKLVLDHGGKPAIADGAFRGWAEDILRLAAAPNAHCKLSGLWTEAGNEHTPETIAPYVDHLLRAFGPQRVMWGSDWPVLELVGQFGDWLEQCSTLLASFTHTERSQIFGDNAMRFYGLGGE